MPKSAVTRTKQVKSPINTALHIDLLMAQYKGLSDDIRNLESATERVFGVGIALVSALVAFAYKERIDEIYFITAPAYLGLLLYAANQWNSVFWKGGYKRYLEDRINDLAHASVVGWEQFAEHSRARLSASYAMFGAFVLISLFAVFGISLVRIKFFFGPFAVLAFALTCGVLFLCLMYSIWKGTSMFSQSYADAKALWPEEETRSSLIPS